ncbi:thiamine-monophosphate kinase [Methylocaldum marinum]|uniref:Thiamine-monophosphate kinase n=1 Tax=Methylocaldum marinum TaxID=1432792 RepID=A0A286P376_9GAMM|nr:thiamine-phosphate kinase [Methylocaldum marinum]BBA32098.1 thiamine-monophosphate kinase [Methylocaldum marinum]
MAIGEFELIRRFFTKQAVKQASTVLGVGDDCALLRVEERQDLAVTADTLVEGVHFLPDVDPESLGHKVLAVNLSDLAAMGAEPRWVTLALTLPHPERAWLQSFARGFFALAERHGVELVGGDTTRGPLTITVQALGLAPREHALRRSGARPGDLVYLTGELGTAGLGLKIRQGSTDIDDPTAVVRLEKPEPRIDAGIRLRGLASSCIDVSDGLAADLGHILEASGVGATIEWDRLPLTDGISRYIVETGDWRMPLSAGDDYELCFTVPPANRDALEQRLAAGDCPFALIGRIESQAGLRLLRDGWSIEFSQDGYQHFTRD